MSQHLIANKGRGQHAGCDASIKGKGVILVETVGAVTCEPCQRLVLSFYGERARHLYPNLKDNVDAS